MKIGCMIWRIGEMLDFFEQLDWLRRHRFEEVSFWSYAGAADKWRGFDLAAAGTQELARLKTALRDFNEVDIHAPSAPWSDLDPGLVSSDAAVQGQALDDLRRLLDRCAECGVKVLTIHAAPPSAVARPEWRRRMEDWLAQADGSARQSGVRIGVELTSDYDLVMSPVLAHVGLTVDTGHMQFNGGAGYRAFGTLGALIERVGPRVFHVHAHDYDGLHDHLAIGRGRLDFAEILRALNRIGFAGSLCLELNPAVVSPEGILESRAALERTLAVV
jgi:sugar phosphate isomerase/epimerase